jgi:murein DD-endopeptidase MepM/ murein hydrolase activator NlpD
VLGLALLGSVSLFGAVTSYVRMAWKVSETNDLRSKIETLRTQYKELQRENVQKDEQLASLEMMASEVTVALGLKRQLDGDDISAEGGLMPTYAESIDEYNFLKGASISRVQRTYARAWQKNVIPTMWPVNGQIVSRFGDRSDPLSGEGAFHAGLDLKADTGTPVHAAADGIITGAQYAGRYGRAVLIDHGNGTSTLYAHLSNFEVVPGEEVRRGQLIGHSGATGRVSGPHLHFEVRQGGVPVNPARYMSRSMVMTQVRPDLPF